MKMSPDEDAAELRGRIIGLGERSFRKSYYPELQKRLEDLERYKTLLDQSSDAIFLIEVPSGNFLSVSETACRQLSFPGGEPRTIYDLLPGNREELDEVFSGRRDTAVFDTTLARRSGEGMPCEINLHRVRLGNKVYAVAVARDRTERKRTEEQMRLFFERQLVGMAITSPDKSWLQVNDELCRMLGYSREELKARTWAELTHPEDLPADVAMFDRLMAGEIDEYSLEKRFIRKDGSEVYTIISIGCVRKAGGVVDYILALVEDITERRRAEEALRKREENFRHMADSSPMPTVLYDAAGNVLYLNKKFTEAYGYTIGDLPSLSCWWPLAYQEPAYRQKVMEEWNDRLEKAKRGSGEIEPMGARVTCKDGKIRDVEFYGTAIGEQRIAVMQDITERKRARKELRESEEKFRALAETSTAAIFILQGDRLVSTNRAMELITGYPREELLGRKMTDFVHPDFKEIVLKRAIGRQRGEPEPQQYEFKIVTGSGTVKWVLLSAGRIIYRGKPAVVGSIFDITDRKRAEEQLRFTQFAIDRAQDQAFWMTSDGHLFYVNEAACRALGYTREELQKLSVPEIDPLMTAERFSEHWRDIKMHGGARFETLHRAKNGRVYPVEIRANYVVFDGKEYNCAFATDITDRKRAEKALQESEENLRMAIEGAHMGMWNWNLATGELIWSERCKEIFGIARDAAMSYEVFIGAVHPEDRERVDRTVRQALEQKTDYNAEMRVLWPDGSLHWVASKGRGFYDADGQAVRMLGIALDITERKLAEEATAEAKAQAELYLDLMSHDITNMNQALMGNLEMMEITSEAGKTDLGLIDSSIEIINRSSRMIDEVKKLTMAQVGRVPPKDVDICEILSAVKARYEKEKDRPVTINFTPGTDCVVRADDLLAVVLDNLVENAVRHSTGPVTIDLGVRKITVAEQDWYEITVADTGPGIPDDLKKRIFMSLKELGEKAVRRGFGLYLVRTLVDHYHGRVWVEDRVPGDYTRGSKFVVQLPSLHVTHV